jgi:hypothetical protein
MAYTTLGNALFTVGARITSSLGMALRDNPIAMFEGASGAPRLSGLAVARESDLAVLTVTAADTVATSFGTEGVSGASETTSATLVVAYTLTISLYTGSIRFRASHRQTGGASSTLEIWKNGAMVDSWVETSGTTTERTKDVAVVPTDVIEWKHKAGGGATSYFGQRSETASDGYVQVVPLAQYSLL